jgi:hypothetical protein
MNKYINKLKETIEPLRQEIINHKVYSEIKEMLLRRNQTWISMA